MAFNQLQKMAEMRKISGSLLVVLIFMFSALHAIAVPTYSKPVMTLGRGSMLCADFSPDDRWCATGSQDGQLTLWDNWNGSRVRDFVGHTIAVRDVRFSPDGNSLYSVGGDGVLIRWDVATGTQLATQTSPDPPISADTNSIGTLLVVLHQSGLVQICDPLTADPLSTVTVITGKNFGPIRFSPRGNYVYAHYSTDHAAIYSLDGKMVWSDGIIFSIYITADEDKVVYDGFQYWLYERLNRERLGGEDWGSWETISNHPFITGYLPESNEAVFQPWYIEIAHHPGFYDVSHPIYSLRLYDLNTDETTIYNGPKANIVAVKISRDGTLLQAAAKDGRIWAWFRSNAQLARNFHVLDTETGSVEFSQNGNRLLTSNQDAQVTEYEFPSGKLLHEFYVSDWKAYTSSQNAHFLQDQSKIGACDAEGNIKIWDAESGELLAHKFIPNMRFKDISNIPDSNDLIAYAEHPIYYWAMPIRSFLYDWHTSQTTDLNSSLIRFNSIFRSPSRILSVGNLQDTTSGLPTYYPKFYELSWPSLTVLRSIQTGMFSSEPAVCLAVSPDHTRAILGKEIGNLLFIDLKSFSITHAIWTSNSYKDPFPDWIKFLPDGNRFLVGYQRQDANTETSHFEIELRDAITGEILANFDAPLDQSNCGDVSPDGKYFAAGQMGHVYIFEIPPPPNAATNWSLYQ